MSFVGICLTMMFNSSRFFSNLSSNLLISWNLLIASSVMP